jgi:gamma-glutamylcyclotransferase (GGCT)/AIG2-like uncharacterized protein YtfP
MNLHNLFLEAGEQPVYYFAYGMLTDPEIMDGIELVGVAKLPNFRYEMFEYANVVHEPGSVVYGCLWKVDRRIIANLDRVEGYPTLYDRKTVPVYVGGQKYVAELYTMTPETREQLADTSPSESYIDKIERGYSHAGVPLVQVDAALDELYDRRQVDEAAMNPASFSAAVNTGQEQGVLVGFEFEVCIPKRSVKTMAIPDEQKAEKHTTEEVVDILYQYDIFYDRIYPNDLAPAEFDRLFKVKPGAQVAYPSLVETSNNYAKDRLPKIKELFNLVTPKKRKDGIQWVKENIPQALKDEFTFAKSFGHWLYNKSTGKDEDLGYKIRRLARADYENLLAAMLETESYKDTMKKFPEVFNFDPDLVYKTLKLDEATGEDEDDWDYDETYTDGAKFLKPYIQQAMGTNVIVYQDYHQDVKNLTDWYIEPDGSLSPSGSDYAAEVVSPPMQANQAMDSLKKFYDLSRKLNLYTSEKNSTGLHINVSIPKDIDILKLAMFLGDQHVLQMFDRQDNEYADSVLKRMQRHDTKLKNNQLDMQLLQKIAQDSTRSHYASISQGGKYLSFRHAGGDYLNRYEDIVNVVGRFVRAMVIASDPNAYRNEYLKKLTIFFKPTPVQNQSKESAAIKEAYNVLRQQGLPMYTFNIMLTSTVSKPATVIGFIDDNSNFYTGHKITSVTSQSAQAKQDIIGKVKNPDIKVRAQQATPQSFITVVTAMDDYSVYSIMGRITRPLPTGVNIIYNNNDKIVGYYTITKTFMPPNDPETKKALKVIAQQYMAELKRERTSARRRATRQRNQAAKAGS